MDDLARALRSEGADVDSAASFALDMYEAAVRAHAYVGTAPMAERDGIQDEYRTQRQLMESRLKQLLDTTRGADKPRHVRAA